MEGSRVPLERVYQAEWLALVWTVVGVIVGVGALLLIVLLIAAIVEWRRASR